MAQSSRPWAGRTPASPGDAGSYTAEQWWNVWGPMLAASNKLTFPALNNIGVFLASDFGGSAWVNATVYPVGSIVRPITDNYHAYVCTAIAGSGTSAGAEPTWPTYPGYTVIDNAGANQITWTCLPPGGLYPYSVANNAMSIAPGVAIVDGNVLESSAIESFVVPNATAGNVRDDRVVARKTFGAATQTTRLVLLTGSEVASPGPGTPPTLTQSRTRATYWDIPIARVSVTDAGVITVTDEREFVDAEMKQIYTQFTGALNDKGGADTWEPNMTPGAIMAPGVISEAYAHSQVRPDYISQFTARPVIIAWFAGAIAGTLDLLWTVRFPACGEPVTAYDEYIFDNVPVPGLNYVICSDLLILELPDIHALDILVLELNRDNGDSHALGIYAHGAEQRYLGWR